MRNVPKAPRTPLLYMVLGFLVGVVIARNAQAMARPQALTAWAMMVIACWLLYRRAVKGKAEAIASAVAIATATATAEAQAHANAVAQQAVAVYIGATANPQTEIYAESLKMLDSVADSSSIANTTTTEDRNADRDDHGVRPGIDAGKGGRKSRNGRVPARS